MQYPVLLPKDVLLSVGQKHIHRLIGAPLERASETLANFWTIYRQSCPGHEIFELGFSEEDFASIIPFYIHGDGGRTYKKESILICSMYAALGRGTQKSQVPDMQPPSSSQPHRRKRARDEAVNEVAMGVNLLGHSLGNRFMFIAIHNKFIKNDKSVFYDLMNLWADELASLLHDGFKHKNRIFRVCVLGLTGDAPFLRDAGLMTRSFSNIKKAANSVTVLPGVCHLCTAGKTNGPHYEDLDILSADWLATTGEHNRLPWDEPSPLLAHLPAEPRNLANFFKLDLFHVWYAGLGKDFCASCLVFLLRSVMRQSNKVESMVFLNQELQRYQRETGQESVHFGKFSWDLLDYEGPRSYPMGKWSKGMDTGKVTKFIEFLVLECLVNTVPDQHIPMLSLIRDACAAIGAFLRTIFKAGFFLTAGEAHQAISAGYRFLKCYNQLAAVALTSKVALFKLKPKAHSMAHLILEMLIQYRNHRDSVCNPVGSSTFMCEDFIGQIARLSRRVSPRVQGTKVIYRYLTALQKALEQES
eukprot:Skav215282  [mRNA]  locus=scaffold2522:114524:116110:+ [translate_table: standard]